MTITKLSHPVLRWISQGIVLVPAVFGLGIFFVPRLFWLLYLGSIVSLWLAIFLFHRGSHSWREGFVFFSFLSLYVLVLEGLFLFMEAGARRWIVFALLVVSLLVSVHIHTVIHADPLHHRRSGFQHLLTILLFLSLLFLAFDGAYARIFLRVELWVAAISVMAGTGLLTLLYLIFFAPLTSERVLGAVVAMLLGIEFFWVLHVLPTNPLVISALFTLVVFGFVITYRDFLTFSLRLREVAWSLVVGSVGAVGLLLTARW